MASTIAVANETKASASRITKDGDKIMYEMTVIQQPERARACGSGAKSSADRRPVDPPPIVQLRVLKNGEDATFSYNANFFLFATLENARTIAQGRGMPSTTTIPVLTGTPVAGMAYLDRPNPAGYFVFPDLSVRHEGKYRLGFSLYEELKEQKDMDTEQITNLEILQQTANPAHVSHRLEVKSQPFTVFSAKKFPGLTESTSLSRLVAEQGCRVRIRRDVRMRRRENKGSSAKDEWDGYEEATADRRHSRTPDAYGQHAMSTPNGNFDGSDRPRSVSNASIASYGMPQRRPSMEPMSRNYQQSYSQPMAPPAPPPSGMYPPQMPYSSSQQQQFQTPAPPVQPPQMQYQQPPQPQYAPPAPPQQQMSMPPTTNSYGYNMQQPAMPQQTMHQQPYSQSQVQPSQPAHDYSQQHNRHNSMEQPVTPGPYRRASMAAEQHPQQNTQYQSLNTGWPETSQTFPPTQSYATTSQSYAPVESNYQTANTAQNNWNPNSSWDNRRNQSFPMQTTAPTSMPSMQASIPTTQQMQPLAPLRTVQPAMPPPSSLSASSPLSAGSVHSPGFSDINSSSTRTSITAPPAPIFNNQMQPQQASNKRSYSSTFDTHHLDQPLRYGARPDVNAYGNGYAPPPPPFAAEGDEGMDTPEDMSAMSYRRADGTERRRRIPAVA